MTIGRQCAALLASAALLLSGCGESVSPIQPKPLENLASTAQPIAGQVSPIRMGTGAQRTAVPALVSPVASVAGQAANGRITAVVVDAGADSLGTSIEFADENGNPTGPPNGGPNAYSGGRYTLPVGPGYSDAVKLADAWALESTQLVVATYVARGYHREWANDAVLNTDSSTTVYLMWSILGISARVKQPVILVHTQP
jgi:hypothetical protein